MLLKSDILAALISWAVSTFLAISVYSLSRQFLSLRGSLIAMAIVYCAPVITFLATYTYVDPAVALFALLALYAVIKWTNSENSRFLALAGIYAGFCAGTKYTGMPYFVCGKGTPSTISAPI